MSGWIKLYRRIRESPLWHEKPFDKARAWIDIIMSANHETRKFLLGNEMVEVERGSFITSEHKLMERWGWSKSKVRAFLHTLENDSMIVKKTDRKKTTLIVLNYCIYQDSETTEEPQKDRKKTAKKPQKDLNKNDKELEEDKKYIFIPDEVEIFSFWNSKGIIKHNESESLQKEIAKALRNFGKEKIILAITQYSTLLHDADFYYSYRFALANFLKQKNGLPNFLEDGQIWVNYSTGRKKNERNGGASSQNEGKRAGTEDEEWPVTNSTTRGVLNL